MGEDAISLAKWLKGLPAKVNLIPFNEAEELSYRRPDDVTIERFRSILADRRVDAFVRKNRGNDISAACGQLRQKWADAPPAHEAPSLADPQRTDPQRADPQRTDPQRA